MMEQLTFDSFSREIQGRELSLVVFGSESLADPLKPHPGLLSDRINYMYVSPERSERLQTRLALEALPAIRLFYGHVDLFSELKFPFQQVHKMDVAFEITEFLKRKLRKSILSETKAKTRVYESMRRTFKSGRGFLFMVFDSRLEVADFRKYSDWTKGSSDFPPLSSELQRQYLWAVQKVYITLSRVLSPLPSFFIQDSGFFRSQLGPCFRGIDLSSSSIKQSKLATLFSKHTSHYFKNLDFSNSSEASPLEMERGLFYFDVRTKSAHPISVLELLEDPSDLVTPTLRISKMLRDHSSQQISNFLFADYKPLFQLPSNRFLFVNADFLDIMMQPPTKKYILDKAARLQDQGISNRFKENNLQTSSAFRRPTLC